MGIDDRNDYRHSSNKVLAVHVENILKFALLSGDSRQVLHEVVGRLFGESRELEQGGFPVTLAVVRKLNLAKTLEGPNTVSEEIINLIKESMAELGIEDKRHAQAIFDLVLSQYTSQLLSTAHLTFEVTHAQNTVSWRLFVDFEETVNTLSRGVLNEREHYSYPVVFIGGVMNQAIVTHPPKLPSDGRMINNTVVDVTARTVTHHISGGRVGERWIFDFEGKAINTL